MIVKPSYEDLEMRVKKLEQEKLEMFSGDIDLKSFMNRGEIHSILDNFYHLTNMPTAILDLNGEIVQAVGWSDICSKFHRVHPETQKRCIESDRRLSKTLKRGECVYYRCKNGLWDVVTPLYVGTKHLGNIFTGQFFYDDEKLDNVFFINQAKQYEFDEELYLKALDQVPRYSKKKVNYLMRFLVNLTTYISKISIANIQLENEKKIRKKVEKTLIKRETIFRKIAVQLEKGLGLVDEEGSFIVTNPFLCKMTGYSNSDLLTMNFIDLIASQTGRAFLAEMIYDKSSNIEVDLKKKDGTVFLAEINGYPIKLENQKFIFLIADDITEIKIGEQEKANLEIRIQQSQKLESLGILAGGIAHDFNNILSSMIGFTELAKLGLNGNEDARSNLEEVIGAGLRARELVKHILKFSRTTNEQKSVIQITPLIKECLKFLKASIPPNIEIHHNFEGTDIAVLSDPTRLHQTLMNLFTNAAYAMKDKGGVLEVKLSTISILTDDMYPFKGILPGRYVQLIIKDTGCGIPEKFIEKIFEPFFTTKGRGEGTGMGLSIVYGIVKDMKGDITVYSEEGIGSTFRILIPEQAGKSQDSLEFKDIELNTGRGKILLVDDEPSIIKWTSQILERLGYEVSGFINSPEAFEKFKADPKSFDLIITDLAMPQMTGLELVKRVKKIRYDIPAILCTGFGADLTKEKIKNCDISDMVMKPLIVSELARVVAKALN